MNKCRKQSQYVHPVLIGFVGAQAKMGTVIAAGLVEQNADYIGTAAPA